MQTMTAPTMTILVAEETNQAERHRVPAELHRNMLRFAETVADPATLPLAQTKQARFTNNSSKAAASPNPRSQAPAKHSRCRHVRAVAKESPAEQVPVLKERGPGMRSRAKMAVDLTRHGRELMWKRQSVQCQRPEEKSLGGCSIAATKASLHAQSQAQGARHPGVRGCGAAVRRRSG